MADLYDVLGVPRHAPQDEIKRVYRRRARELHPDAGGDAERFKEVTHAYEVLADPERRARYDRFGDDGRRGQVGEHPFGAGFGNIEDVIDAFFGFGGGFATTRPRRARDESGRDVIVGIELELEEVATGTQRAMPVEVADVCDVCGGSGSATGSPPVRCGVCGGSGRAQRVVRTVFGQMATTTTCGACGGGGLTVADPCSACGGEGRRVRARTVTVAVPAGVADGDRLRVAGAGEAGRRGQGAGDLYVEVRIREHDVFERDGRDLWCDVTVPFVHAALGAELAVPSLTGDPVVVHVPPGSQPGDVLSARRAGLPGRGGTGPGDLHLRLHVEVPRDLTAEQVALLREFASLRGEEAPPAGKGLFRRLREVFR